MKPFSPEFFKLQFQFAQKVHPFTKQSTFDLLVNFTILRFLLQLYVVPNGDAEPLWFELIDRFERDADAADWIYALYQERLEKISQREQQRVATAFGCFSYAYPFRNKPALRLHFHNRPDLAEQGLLSNSEMAARHAELTELFRHVRQTHPEAQAVVGGSWMYYLEAYRRLFPLGYLKTAVSGGYETGFFALWGQFVRGNGQVRKPIAHQFLTCLAQQKSLPDCLACFPYDVLRLQAPIDMFYAHYQI